MTRARAALFLTAVAGMWVWGSPSESTPTAEEGVPRPGAVVLYVMNGVPIDRLMADLSFQRLVPKGGAALMTTKTGSHATNDAPLRTILDGAEPTEAGKLGLGQILGANGVTVCQNQGEPTFPSSSSCRLPAGSSLRCCDLTTPTFFLSDTRLARPRGTAGEASTRHDVASQALEWLDPAFPPPRVLVLVVSPAPSAEMDAEGNEVTPIVMAERSARPIGAPTRGLRSDTTRMRGLVANVDVAPTILDFFEIPIPKEMTGNPIRIDGTVDLAHLHQLHLDQRRLRLPIQLGELAFVCALAIAGVAALVWLGIGRSLPSSLRMGMRFLALCGAALLIPLMAGGLLPRLTYPVVVPFLVLTVVALAAAALVARWPGVMGPFSFLGLVGLAFVVLEGVLGWRGARIPLLGGTMFDGVRFYGLPNSFIALLLGSALFVAVGFPAFTGFLLLMAAGLFAGFPNLGANVGASITLFVGAGVWWVLRTRPRFGMREAALGAGTVALGLAAVLLANRYLPGAPTHVTGFVERTGGLAGALRTLGGRLSIGFGQIADVPPAILPLIGLVAALALLILRPEPIRTGLESAGERWRDGLIALTVAGIAAFFVNDTGVAAAAPVFLYAMTALAYPAYVTAGRA